MKKSTRLFFITLFIFTTLFTSCDFFKDLFGLYDPVYLELPDWIIGKTYTQDNAIVSSPNLNDGRTQERPVAVEFSRPDGVDTIYVDYTINNRTFSDTTLNEDVKYIQTFKPASSDSTYSLEVTTLKDGKTSSVSMSFDTDSGTITYNGEKNNGNETLEANSLTATS